ncbi:MAG TPA: hypothetical protein VH413_14665 [Verrucomicrobiae bacterium]|jgi:hypothetical protein|nr:hypothetical protein [Verrucomicrobiae bacterium]
MFSSNICLGLDEVSRFIAGIEKLIQCNSGTANLYGYSQESKISIMALEDAPGEMIVGGVIAIQPGWPDDEIYPAGRVPIGQNASGMIFSFGGFQTDQSYLHDVLVSFRLLARDLAATRK